jgi:hypothetical protein
MDHALRLLLRLRLKGWLRRLGRAMNTVKGLLITILGGMFFSAWLVSLVAFQEKPSAVHLDDVRLYGPATLLLVCLLNYLLAAGERVLAFSPAEVNLLFPAPFSRRQLLLYKIAVIVFSSLVFGLFMGLVLRQHASGYVASLVGVTLAWLFLQFFALAIALLVSIIGVQAYNRQRKFILLAVLAMAAVVIWHQSKGHLQSGVTRELVSDVRQNRVVQVMLAPFVWQIDTMTAANLWPDLIRSAGLSLLAVLVLLGIILMLDVHYLEAAATASERTYRRLERLRRGGMASVGLTMREKARWSLPSLPYWGGIGPMAWRQLLGALRGIWWIIPVGIFMSAFLVPILFVAGQDKTTNATENAEGTIVGFGVMLLFMGMFLPSLLTFDFRADLDRMEVLKTLPLAAWKIVIGQLLVPVLIVTLVQSVMLAALQAALPGPQPIVLAYVPFLLLVNFVFFGVENLFFLWFPTRQLAATPGDVQNFGRVLMLLAAKYLVLMALVTVATLFGVGIFYLTGGSFIAAGAVVLICVAACTVAIMPLLCLAFHNFDVSRDTPP